MRALDIIIKKRDGDELSRDEIEFLVAGYVDGTIPDYQVSALLMAILLKGMTADETGVLTHAMIDSGATIDLSGVTGPFVDKHSTGGVGDKVSLILAPIAAACGARVPMMSGRSLGHTGGTLDKLDAIPGYSTSLSPERFAAVINECGFAMTGQSASIVPADRKLYALRDVTGTVESVPLITSSILSKKFAEGSDALIFDVKCGAGAFMKTPEAARELAQSLVDTGRSLGKEIVAVLTRMDTPLGCRVGNMLEVEESLALLGWAPALDACPIDARSDDLAEVTYRLTAWMLVATGIVDSVEAGEARCREVVEDGSAWRAMESNIRLQGGSLAQLQGAVGSMRAPVTADVPAPAAGVVTGIDAFAVGMAGVYLGAGRNTATDDVFPDVGLELLRKPGDRVADGEAVLRVWGHSDDAVQRALGAVGEAVSVGPGAPDRQSMILEERSTL